MNNIFSNNRGIACHCAYSLKIALFVVVSFMYFCLDIIYDTIYKMFMRDGKYFVHPTHEWQKRYEALRASFVERLPATIVAERFGYTPAYIHFLRHQFTHGKIDFSEPVPEGKANRRGVDSALRLKICNWRRHNLSAGEITQLLSEEGVEISIRTVERVLEEEGFPKLPRRSKLKIGLTVKGAEVPAVSEAITVSEFDRKHFECEDAGVFLFAPFIERLNIQEIVRKAGLPGTKSIPAISYFLSFLALKLIGTERYAHVGDHAFNPGLGLFSGLNVIPKCTSCLPIHIVWTQST